LPYDKVQFNNLTAPSEPKYFENKLVKLQFWAELFNALEKWNFLGPYQTSSEIAFGAVVINFCSYNLD
jgi:hypothetical protein